MDSTLILPHTSQFLRAYFFPFESTGNSQALNISLQDPLVIGAIFMLTQFHTLRPRCGSLRPLTCNNNYKYVFASACLKITVLQLSILEKVQEGCGASSSQHSETGSLSRERRGSVGGARAQRWLCGQQEGKTVHTWILRVTGYISGTLIRRPGA